MTASLTYPPARLSWTVWGLGAVFYFTGFYQRVAPAVMTDQLMSDFQIGAAALGHFSAFYFYSYVAMQIPTGVLADHWGPRKLLTAGSVVAALGTLLFAMAQSLAVANLGRLLIGGSVAVAWVTILKLATHWFPSKRFATVSGVALLCGVAGAVWAGVPLRFMVESFGWRGVMLFMSLFTLFIGIAVWFAVRDDPSESGYASFAPCRKGRPGGGPVRFLSGLGQALRYRNTFLLSVAQGALTGSALTFCGLWGIPYLTARYGLTPSAGSAITSLIMVVWAAGGPVLGAFSDRIQRRKLPYLIAAATASLGWISALYIPQMPLWLFVVIAASAGFACGAVIIGFAFVKESAPAEFAGTTSGICNMGAMGGPMIMQPAIGWVLDMHWKGAVSNGARIYDPAAYHTGFLLMAAWLILGVVLVCFSCETHCRQRPAEGSDS